MKTTPSLAARVTGIVRFGALVSLLAFTAGTTTGCATYKVSLAYQPSSALTPREDSAQVFIGSVTDSRGTDANWLGAIRGGFGNPLKKLYTDEETTVVVRKSIEAALQVRGMLGTEGEGHRLDITIDKFDTSSLAASEAHAHLSVSVFEVATEKNVFTHSYVTDRAEGSIGPGVFGNVSALTDLANRTLNETIDKLLDDPGFYVAVGGEARGSGAGENPLAERLKQLDDLLSTGLITQEEYDQARKEILEEL